jgi:hypothetical protein
MLQREENSPVCVRPLTMQQSQFTQALSEYYLLFSLPKRVLVKFK